MEENTFKDWELVDEDAAAPILGTTPQALQHWRRMGRGPRYLRTIGRIRYRVSDLKEFLNRCTVETVDSRQPATVNDATAQD
jgi:hypothetical protein